MWTSGLLMLLMFSPLRLAGTFFWLPNHRVVFVLSPWPWTLILSRIGAQVVTKVVLVTVSLHLPHSGRPQAFPWLPSLPWTLVCSPLPGKDFHGFPICVMGDFNVDFNHEDSGRTTAVLTHLRALGLDFFSYMIMLPLGGIYASIVWCAIQLLRACVGT